jgi:hypothetical protein
MICAILLIEGKIGIDEISMPPGLAPACVT